MRHNVLCWRSETATAAAGSSGKQQWSGTVFLPQRNSTLVPSELYPQRLFAVLIGSGVTHGFSGSSRVLTSVLPPSHPD